MFLELELTVVNKRSIIGCQRRVFGEKHNMVRKGGLSNVFNRVNSHRATNLLSRIVGGGLYSAAELIAAASRSTICIPLRCLIVVDFLLIMVNLVLFFVL